MRIETVSTWSQHPKLCLSWMYHRFPENLWYAHLSLHLAFLLTKLCYVTFELRLAWSQSYSRLLQAPLYSIQFQPKMVLHIKHSSLIFSYSGWSFSWDPSLSLSLNKVLSIKLSQFLDLLRSPASCLSFAYKKFFSFFLARKKQNLTKLNKSKKWNECKEK